MAISKIWIVAEIADGKVATSSLELLTAARATGATVEAIVAGDGAAVAAELGSFGATKVYSTGDLGGALLGVPVASAIAGLVAGGNAPDAILMAQTYDGRDIAGRLSVKLDKTVLTNAVGVAVAGDTLVAEHAVFGGSKILKASFTGAGPFLVLVRPKSFAAEASGGAAAAVETIAVPEGPANLKFGGPDKKTLFITARTSFYSVPMRVKGQ